jgi:choline dehydrogenase
MMSQARTDLELSDSALESYEPEIIVVGSGSAGSATTRRLVDHGLRVLLLEAGGEDVNPAIHDPARLHELWLAEEDWAFETVPQRHAADRCLAWPRGRVIGGSSSLNGMIWVRGAPVDYDTWAYLGAAGWAWDDVRPIFERIERREPGDGGVVTILSDYEADPIHQAIVAAAQECGIPFNRDYNRGVQDGVSYLQLSIADRVRHSCAAAYLRPVIGASNLGIRLRARARRLLFEGARCVGVEWSRAGKLERKRAAEVIVCGGTIGSPHLLMLSGVGPADHLRAHGIDVTADVPGVGENLHDHLLSPVIFSAQREIGPPSPGLPACQTHLFCRSRAGLIAPDIQPIHFMVPMYEPWMEGPDNGFTLLGGMIRPASRGTIRLSGPTLEDRLLIDPNVLACEPDLDRLVAAVELCRRMGQSGALRDWGVVEGYPGPSVTSAEDLRDYVRKTAITYHHQVGTSKMGIDELAVVDPQLRVYGVEGLRVADASVMPTVTTGNTNAPSVMIGERAADFVTGRPTSRMQPASGNADDPAGAMAGLT